MADDLGEGIYRAMIEERDGMPQLGPSASTLGIRKGVDIELDAAGLVHRPAFHPQERNGLSCSRSIAHIPRFALPVAWGGHNKRTVVWRLDPGALGSELVAGDDPTPGVDEHVSIGPAATMAFDDFARAIESTRPQWTKVTKELRTR